MTSKVKQRLCGGTFFTLLLQARKPRKGVREHYMGEVDGLSDPQTLIALINIAVPDYSAPDASMMTTFKGNTSRYKSCQNNGGTYMPFSDRVTMQSFDNRVRTDYASVLSLMRGFSEDFIDFGTSTRKDYWLVKAFLELLDEDDSIDDDQEIYAREDGVATTKSAMLAASTFCLQPLLLGLWHFVLLNRADNRVGKGTYDLWCPATGSSERAYTYTLGETITRTICITYSTQSHPTVDTEIIDEDIVEDAGPEAQAKSAPNTSPAQSVVNNNPTFFTFNVTGNNNSFINKVDTVIIKNGGRKDE